MSSKKQTYQCNLCKVSFETYNIGQQYCSRKCGNTARSNNSKVSCICLTCSKSFILRRGKINEGRGKYCSKDCSHKRPKNYCVNEFKDLWDKGFSVHKISTLVDASEETIRSWAKKTNRMEHRRASGKDCHNWKGGIKSYRKKVFSVTDKVCQLCGFKKHPQIIEVHHIDKNRKNNSLSNLIPLCPTCHKCVHRNLMKIPIGVGG